MVKIRRYVRSDIPVLHDLLKKSFQSFRYKDFPIDDKKVLDTLNGNEKNIRFFCNVVEVDGEIVGAMVSMINTYIFNHDVYAQDCITFIHPDHRGLKAITGLVKSYVEWGKQRGVRELHLSQSTAFKMDKFVLLAKRLGFTQIGTRFVMELR